MSASPFKVQTIHEMYEEMTQEPIDHYDYYRIIWIIQGRGTHCTDMHQCCIETNCIFGVKPGQMHRFVPEENTGGFIISFTEDFLAVGEFGFDITCPSNFSRLFSKKSGIQIKDETLSDIREIVSKMMKEYENAFLFKTEILKRYLKIFLIYLTRQFDESFELTIQTRNTEMVQNFKNLLEKNFKEKKMVAEYAGELYVTPNYLNEIIKKITGYSAGYHIRQRVVLEAKRIAMYSDLSMKEIAYELGFLDSCHFSKFFKAVTGRNFSDFKKEKTIARVTEYF